MQTVHTSDAVRICRCPRCGYELSGVMSSWRDSCPLRGTCSECGLEFDWGRMASGEGLAPSWSFEHGEISLRRFVGTWVRAAAPWMLWRGVPLECPVHRGRLILLLLACLPLVHVMMAGIMVFMDDPMTATGPVKYESVAHWLSLHVREVIEPEFMQVRGVALGIPVVLAACLLTLMPLSLLVLRARSSVPG